MATLQFGQTEWESLMSGLFGIRRRCERGAQAAEKHGPKADVVVLKDMAKEIGRLLETCAVLGQTHGWVFTAPPHAGAGSKHAKQMADLLLEKDLW